MTGNDAIFEVHALMYVTLSKADEYVPYGEPVGTRECITLYPICRTHRGHYNRVRL